MTTDQDKLLCPKTSPGVSKKLLKKVTVSLHGHCTPCPPTFAHPPFKVWVHLLGQYNYFSELCIVYEFLLIWQIES